MKNKINYPTERLPVKEHSIESRELQLFTENDERLYRQRVVPIQTNLVTKIARGTFDINKAPIIYKYLIDDAIKRYNQENGGGMELSKDEKMNLANIYVNEFLDEARYGNYENYLPKKYKMAEGGPIKNQYHGKTDSQMWTEWKPSQRKHFLHDHKSFLEEEAEKHGVPMLEDLEQYINSDYKSLPGPIKDQLFFHRYAGEYSKGGKVNNGMNKGGKISAEKAKIQSRIKFLKSSLSTIKSSVGKKVVQKKIDKLECELNYTPSVKEKVSNKKGKFYIDVPTQYAKPIYRKLWGMGIKPELYKLNGNTKVVVNNSANIAKAYKIYSDLVTDKGGMVGSMAKITGKV